ncbi:MAG: limonene,2-epoxide hydrolase [Acidimicrobiales bacterium]|nr:limonene,2-epoxide hydrolase [Acidimicrobiales bacterium]
MDAPDAPVEVVRRFCAAWADGDLDAIVGAFTDDAVYHNIPLDPVVGPEAIRTFIEGFIGGVDSVEFQIRNIVGSGDVVLTERVDVFVAPGKRIELPVMGTFELRDGRIAAWRDYFDLQSFMSAFSA